jgi:amino acid transporter
MSQNPAASSLPRVLGPIAATAIVVGTIIGSGVFVKPHIIAKNVEYSGLVAMLWIVGGLLVLLGALAYAEVASVLPRVGGNYVFLGVAYGRLWGFLWGWVDFWIIRAASLAALGTIFSGSLAKVVGIDAVPSNPAGFWTRTGVTLLVLILLAWVNIRGVRWGSGLQVVVTAVKIGSLVFILALPWLLLAGGTPGPVSSTNLNPIWPDDWSSVQIAGLGSAFLGILWAYHGWQNIAGTAGEITNPQRNIPLSLLGGVAIVIFLYLGANLAYYTVMNRADMVATEDPATVAAVACDRLLGPVGVTFALLAIMISTFGSLNGNILVGPRLLFAMGEDGLAPRALSHVHPTYRTPDKAIALLVLWSCLLVAGTSILQATEVIKEKSPFDMLTDFAMFGAIVFETMAVVAVFVLRYTHPHVERPYKCPGYPIVPLLYVVLPAFILYNMFSHQQREIWSGVGIVLAGVVVYFALGLNRTAPAPVRESA